MRITLAYFFTCPKIIRSLHFRAYCSYCLLVLYSRTFCGLVQWILSPLCCADVPQSTQLWVCEKYPWPTRMAVILARLFLSVASFDFPTKLLAGLLSYQTSLVATTNWYSISLLYLTMPWGIDCPIPWSEPFLQRQGATRLWILLCQEEHSSHLFPRFTVLNV